MGSSFKKLNFILFQRFLKTMLKINRDSHRRNHYKIRIIISFEGLG